MVGIMERPSVSSNPEVARAIASAAVQVDEQVSPGDCEDVRRDAFKRIRQRLPVLNLDYLGPQCIQSEVDMLFRQAVKAASDSITV